MIRYSPFERNQEDSLLFVKNYKLMNKKHDISYLNQDGYYGTRQHSKTLHDQQHYLQSKNLLDPNSSLNSSYYSNSLNHSRSAQHFPRRKPTIFDYERIRQQEYDKQSQLLNMFGPQALRYSPSYQSQKSPIYIVIDKPSQHFKNNSIHANNSRIENINSRKQDIPQMHSSPRQNQNIYRDYDMYPYNSRQSDIQKRQEIFHRSYEHNQSVHYHNPQSYMKQSPKRGGDNHPYLNVVRTKQTYDSYNNKPIQSPTYINRNKYNTIAGNNNFGENQYTQTRGTIKEEAYPFGSSNQDLRDVNWKSVILNATNTGNPYNYESGDEQSFRNNSKNINNGNHRKTINQQPEVLEWHSKLFHRIS